MARRARELVLMPAASACDCNVANEYAVPGSSTLLAHRYLSNHAPDVRRAAATCGAHPTLLLGSTGRARSALEAPGDRGWGPDGVGSGRIGRCASAPTAARQKFDFGISLMREVRA